MPDWLDAWLDLELWDISLQAWLTAAGLSLACAMTLLLTRHIVVTRWRANASKTRTKVDDFAVDLIARTRAWFLVGASIAIGTLALDLSDQVRHQVFVMLVILGISQLGAWGSWLVRVYIEHRFGEGADTDPAKRTGMTILQVIAQVAVWSVVGLVLLDQIGVDITALVAGLGVAGIAVGLALQNVLGDLFASISILLDKPFVVGDFIVVGEFSGTVEEIGIKTTRVRSLGGEELIFANNDLLQSRVRNYKRMQERRVVFQLGVVYQTGLAQLEAIPTMMRDIVASTENVRFDRAHFMRYGDSSLVFEVVYYVLGNDYLLYAESQQTINLAIFRQFEREGIEFAYPTQTLHTMLVQPPTAKA
jgi:small-conductance mechanosensitive channel